MIRDVKFVHWNLFLFVWNTHWSPRTENLFTLVFDITPCQHKNFSQLFWVEIYFEIYVNYTPITIWYFTFYFLILKNIYTLVLVNRAIKNNYLTLFSFNHFCRYPTRMIYLSSYPYTCVSDFDLILNFRRYLLPKFP